MAATVDSQYDVRRRAFVDGIIFRFVALALMDLIIFATAMASNAPPSRFLTIILISPPYAVLNALCWYVGKRENFPLGHFFFHWFVDLVVISVSIYSMGGLDVPYGPFIYSMIVITSAIFMSRRGSYLVASAATACLVLMAIGVRWQLFTPPAGVWSHHYSPAGQLTVVIGAVVFFFLNAYLAGTLSDQLKVAKAQIEDQNHKLEERVHERTRALEARTLQLQERKDELEELVYIVTHDLQNVAVASAETTRKLIEVDGSKVSARGQRYVDRLQRDCRLMATMLRNLLDVVAQTEIVERRELVDVASVVRECIATAQGVIESKGIEVVVGDLPALRADGQKLHHIFENLLSNACKYVGDKPNPRVEIGASEVGDVIEYYVSDNGIGIEPNQISRIFTLYHRAPDQTVAGVVQQGHGIGLAVVKRIVQRYGGRMWVESVAGVGATFRFTFPVAESVPLADDEVIREEEEQRMSNTALLVEDNTSHAEMIADELDTALPGWVLESATTLAEARRMIGSRKFQLFVFDFRLPDGDGIELLREVRSSGVDTPTIFVTTASSAKLAVEAMKLGADDYLVKEEGYLSVLPYLVKEVLKRRQLAVERQELEERLQRAERAASLGYLASGLAHHINNPLATIRTFLQLLPTNINDPEFRTKYLEMALAESERIRDLVRDIMRAATVPQVGHEVQRVEEIVARAEDGVAAEVKRKQIVINKKFPEAMPPIEVHGEAATCLVLTLLQNAVRFSPEGSVVEIETFVEEGGERLGMLVRDRGPGVPADHREKIFEPFFTTAVDGLGMGLFVASRIADLQHIGLLLEEGTTGGATFRVSFRIAGQAEAAMSAAV